MLTEVKNNLLYFINALKVSIKSAMAYKVSFVIQAVFMVFNNLFFLLVWKVILNNSPSQTDISFNGILYLWSISTMSFGIAYFFFGGIKSINEYILNGTMDSFMLQPKNLYLNVISSKCKFSACGDFIYGLVLSFVATGCDIPKVFLMILFSIIGSTFFISAEVIFRSLTVWLGDTHALASKYTETLLITFSTYPENIFSTGIKVLLYTIVPVAYLDYLPIRMLTETFSIPIFLVIVLVSSIFMLLSIYVFNKAMKNYESGNNMSMKD